MLPIVNLRKENAGTYAGLFLVCLCVLSAELVINRLVGLRFWYHFAFLIISLALFGIGVGSLFVFFLNSLLKKIPRIALAAATYIFALSLPLSLLMINRNPLEMDLLSQLLAQQANFARFFLVLSVPFVVAGFITAYLFTNSRSDINNLYFFDLAGGGLGCLFTLIVFPHRGPYLTSYVIFLLLAVAGILFSLTRKRWLLAVIPGLLVAVAGSILFLPSLRTEEPVHSKYKAYTYPLGKSWYKDWDNFGLVAVHPTSGRKDAVVVTANYSCYANMFALSNQAQFEQFRKHQVVQDNGYPFVVRPRPDDVGIVGVGGGKDVLISLVLGAKKVWGAEFEPAIYDILRNKFVRFNGNIGWRSNVRIYRAEGRYFVRSSKRKYDILLFDNAIAVAAVQSGAYTLAEGYLYTVEAIVDYMKHLKPEGVLYLSNPLPDYPRFITIIREAYRKMGRGTVFADSIIVVDNMSPDYRRCKVLVKNKPFTAKEVGAVASFAAGIGQKVLYAPYGEWQTEAGRLVRTKNIASVYERSTTELRPSSDDWPFYTQRVKAGQVRHVMMSKTPDHYWEGPFVLILKITDWVLLFSLLFLLLPLLLFNLKGIATLRNKAGSVVYFAALGLAFMFMEIVLMQKYMLILGHPVYSFSVVLSSLLISSGVGSILSGAYKDPYDAARYGFLGILASTVIAWIFIRFLGEAVIPAPFVLRVLVITVLSSLSGVFMGFMMPAGIRAVSASENTIPWLWSVNGIFSVLASFLAIICSIRYGFTAVMALSLVIYALGTLFFCFRIVPARNG